MLVILTWVTSLPSAWLRETTRPEAVWPPFCEAPGDTDGLLATLRESVQFKPPITLSLRRKIDLASDRLHSPVDWSRNTDDSFKVLNGVRARSYHRFYTAYSHGRHRRTRRSNNRQLGFFVK